MFRYIISKVFRTIDKYISKSGSHRFFSASTKLGLDLSNLIPEE